MNKFLKRLGRKAAGSWGRLGSRLQKRAAAKAVRRWGKTALPNQACVISDPTSMPKQGAENGA